MQSVLEFVRRDAAALRRSFYFHHGNSDAQKIVTWGSLVIAGIIVLGIAFGLVNYATLPGPIQTLVLSSVSLAVYLFGRLHGKESALLLVGDAPPVATGPSASHAAPVPAPESAPAAPPAVESSGGGEQ
jgi:hypothetical protein